MKTRKACEADIKIIKIIKTLILRSILMARLTTKITTKTIKTKLTLSKE